MQRAPSRVTFLVPAVVCLAVALAMAVQLLRPLRDEQTWTPLAQAPTLDQAQLEVELWLDGRRVDDVLAAGELRMQGREQPLRVTDVQVRLNHGASIGRVQVVLLSVTATAGLTLLAVALAIPRRRSTPGVNIGDPEIAP